MNTQTVAILETIDWKQRAEQAEAEVAGLRDGVQSVLQTLYDASMHPPVDDFRRGINHERSLNNKMILELATIGGVEINTNETVKIPTTPAPCPVGCQNATGAPACGGCPFPVEEGGEVA